MPNTSTEVIEPLAVRPKEAWRLLSCSNSYGYELLAAGELDSFADGSARKITVSSIKAYIARRLAKSGKVRKSPRKNRKSPATT
jgi:excisionase family DNA binding protein